MPLPSFWRVPPHAVLDWRRWPDESEYVFYHGATGDTHLLSDLAGRIMEQALQGPLDVAVLLKWLISQGDTEAENTLDNVITGLAQLEFLEPIRLETVNNAGG